MGFFLGMAAFVLPSTTAIKDKLNKKICSRVVPA